MAMNIWNGSDARVSFSASISDDLRPSADMKAAVVDAPQKVSI